jgi:hypothetical protein
VRYELPNLGVAVTVPGDILVRTALVDRLQGIAVDPAIDTSDYVGQLRLSPLHVSAVGGLGLVGFTGDGSTMLTVSATQSSDVAFDVVVPAGRAHLYPDETPGDGWDMVSGYVDLPADDFMLGVSARSTQLVSDDLEDIVWTALEAVEILGAPATTQAATGAGTGADIDAAFDAWIPDTLGDRPTVVSAFSGRYALAHPVFDGRTPSALALLCTQLAQTADDLSFVVALPGGDRSGPVRLDGCRVSGATTDAWLPLLAPGLERADLALTAFRVPEASVPTRIVLAGQALLIVTARSDEIADAVLSSLPEAEIPADTPIGG